MLMLCSISYIISLQINISGNVQQPQYLKEQYVPIQKWKMNKLN